jgi:uncharacterized protein YbjT (DUF2867 family)
MKLIIIGGTGLIGSRLVTKLREQGHEPVAASPDTGVNTGIPYSIVHATQFFEFVGRIADEATDGTTVRLPPVLIQPMAADDVAKAIGRIAMGAPKNGTVEVAGPQQFCFDDLIRQSLGARNDPREGVVGPHARYFGAELGERSLIPADDARLGEIRFQEWLNQ